MSWEDCGFKPGKINGPAKCARQCSDCDGEHHFYAHSGEWEDEDEYPPEDWEPEMYFACKHCGATAEMVSDDDEMQDALDAGMQDDRPDAW